MRERGFIPEPCAGIVYRALGGMVVAVIGLGAVPSAASAQMGIYDALARRFSDVSFFVSSGGVLPKSSDVSNQRMVNYGIEVLLEIGGIDRPTGPAPARRDSVALVWTGMEVVRTAEGVDTINRYDVRPVVQRAPFEPIWTFEVGIGYGQLTGFGLRAEELDMRGAVRDLPALSLYATYEPLGGYFGVRSGFMKFQGLQVFDAENRAFSGDAEGFMAGVALGSFFELVNLSVFGEAAYTWRDFPSIKWSGAGPLPAGIPRGLGLSGWSLGLGLQFSVGRS